jgi:hypothetical protein
MSTGKGLPSFAPSSRQVNSAQANLPGIRTESMLSSVNQELLNDGIGNVAADIDSGRAEHQPNSTIACRIVSVGNRARGKVASKARIVRLPLPVVPFAHKRVPERMPHARSLAARSLDVVPRILVQNRRQDRPSDKDVRDSAGIVGPKSLPVTLRSLNMGSLHQTSKIVRLGLLRKPVAIPKPSAIHFCNTPVFDTPNHLGLRSGIPSCLGVRTDGEE